MSSIPKELTEKLSTLTPESTEELIKLMERSEKEKRIIVERNQIALKLLNKILLRMGKEPIDTVTKFMNIRKEELQKQENILAIEEMEKEIFQYYNKRRCRYYRRSQIQNYMMVFLKHMCEGIGKELQSSQALKYNDDTGKRESIRLYSIIDKPQI